MPAKPMLATPNALLPSVDYAGEPAGDDGNDGGGALPLGLRGGIRRQVQGDPVSLGGRERHGQRHLSQGGAHIVIGDERR